MVGIAAQLRRGDARRKRADPAAQSISARERLRAWWRGEAPRLDIFPPEDDAAALASSQEDRRPAESEDAASAVDVSTGRKAEWSPGRIDVCGQLWGEGFVSPGGPEYILQLAKPLALDPSMSVADLGAGLGGAARTMAEEFGTWVTGYEDSANLIEHGSLLSEMAGFSKKASIRHYDANALSLNRRYDCFFRRKASTRL